ncbi:MAG: electron transport complex subunit RsxE [Halothiobacillus sp. 20-53-49]|nr:MAG: electron transport complex subunit RsxE [Halothiobacillus sp. 20-53-49]HUM99924.1 electron transport complex subunit E [Halothiobacillus sp.]
MSDVSYRELTVQGLWKNNPGLVQILGMCPMMAISNTVVNAMGLALATILTMVISNGLASAIRHWVRPEVRLPVFVMVVASVVTVIELLMNAYLNTLYHVLGIFLPLIVTNCIVIARVEGFAARNRVLPSLYDGLMMGLGFGLVLVSLGVIREILGFGTLLANAQQLFGPVAANWTLHILPEQAHFLLAILPPGAFMALAVLIALKQGFEQRQLRLHAQKSTAGLPNAAIATT